MTSDKNLLNDSSRTMRPLYITLSVQCVASLNVIPNKSNGSIQTVNIDSGVVVQ